MERKAANNYTEEFRFQLKAVVVTWTCFRLKVVSITHTCVLDSQLIVFTKLF
ncbi:hypothetical protein JCM19039_2312 [Geomicrobium sp. JCM 19039]|nr:hypothetical protein JCM19039_2312 [Geomicrobium sp. JCM 19039]